MSSWAMCASVAIGSGARITSRRFVKCVEILCPEAPPACLFLAVAALGPRTWLDKHWDDPVPTHEEKVGFAQRHSITTKQVSHEGREVKGVGRSM